MAITKERKAELVKEFGKDVVVLSVAKLIADAIKKN